MSQRIGSTQQGRNQREQFYDSQKIIEELGIKFKAAKTSNGVEEWYFNIMLAIGEGLTWWLSSILPSRTGRFDPWVRKIPWRRKWQSITVLLRGKSHGQRSLAGYSPWGQKSQLKNKQQLLENKTVARGQKLIQDLSEQEMWKWRQLIMKAYGTIIGRKVSPREDIILNGGQWSLICMHYFF